MAFTKANILTTHETVFGTRKLGQIIAVPSSRLDKVSVYLEPLITDTIAAQSIPIYLEVYDLDGFGLPTGSALATDYKYLSDINIAGFINFRLEAAVPTIVAIVLSVPDGNVDNNVSWRYVASSVSGEEQLIFNGSYWTANPTRKFSYKTYSLISNVIDLDEQTAKIQAGALKLITDDTNAEFSIGELNRTVVDGDTVIVNFGDFVVNLVVDQSGSMTWNDRNGLRFEFLKDFIADIDASLPLSSTATYSLIKFRGRQIGSLNIAIQGTETQGLHLDGIRLVRKAGSAPADITDGVVVFEGLAEQYVDAGAASALVPGTTYYYSAFSFAQLGGNNYYSELRNDFTKVVIPPISNSVPLQVANFNASAKKTTSLGVNLVSGDTDFGYRKVNLSWINPAGYDYSTITLVRRNDRAPESPNDGTVLLSNVAATTTSYVDTFSGTYSFINGINYYYRIFTKKSTEVKSILPNSPLVTVAIPSTDRPWELLEPPLNIPPGGFDVTPPGSPIVSVEESAGEIRLSITPADSDSKRYKIYYHETRFPISTDNAGRSYDGDLLYDGTKTTFTHRFLTNSEPHFYSIIALDNVENASIPTQPLVASRPPKPNVDATIFFPPDPVIGFSVENLNATSNILRWKNPIGPKVQPTFYFGDSVRVISTVEFIDTTESQNSFIYEFIEKDRRITTYDGTIIDPQVGILFAHVPSINSNSIAAVVSVTNSTELLNIMQQASISMSAALLIKNSITGEIIAKVETNDITVTFNNPFELAIKNEPEQKVNRRTWQASSTNDPGLPCQEFEYKIDSFIGVYVKSGTPIFALLESSFKGLPLGSALGVDLRLLDNKTKELTTIVSFAETATAVASLQITDSEDEVVDRSGQPTGEARTRSILPLTLPPSNVPTDLLLQATATFQGYSRTVELELHYEPTLNLDLNLIAFSPDNVDRTEQAAFVYFGAFDALQDQKVPVKDLTVTTWSIKKLCKGIPDRPLQSEDNVPGLGVKAYTRGGVASKIFWGPGDEVIDDQIYEVNVKVQSEGQSGEAFGLLTLGPPTRITANKIFLRNQDTTKFNLEAIFSDGESVSKWEVLGKPSEEISPNVTSGSTFVDAVVFAGGNVPPGGLENGRIITMNVKLNNDANPSGNPLTPDENQEVLNSIRIKTNMTGPNGKARSAKAKIENGKALFEISVNARVPEPKESISEQELIQNLFYKRYGILFQKPKSGLSLTLTVVTAIEINGKSVAFYGGGENLVTSAPPCFIELNEPLRLA